MTDNKKQALVFSYNPQTGESNFDIFSNYHEAMTFYNAVQTDFPKRKFFLGTQVQGRIATQITIGKDTFLFGKGKDKE